MKKLLWLLMGVLPLSAIAELHTGVYNHSVPVQCNGWGWTGEEYNFTIWKNSCTPLEVQGGASIATTKDVCPDGQLAEYRVTHDRHLVFIRCNNYSHEH
jgi:hypothetical protein